MTDFTRKEIYDLAWTQPMTAIAQKYEISDVGFRKICIRLKIPIPKVGYWAKIKAGHHCKKTILPPNPGGPTSVKLKERKPGAPVKKTSDLIQRIKEASKKPLPFKVPDRLINPDPLTVAARESLKILTDSRHPKMAVTEKDQLDIRVSPANIGRAVRFMDTLVKCIKARGYQYITAGKANYIVINDVQLPVKFRERTSRVTVNKRFTAFEWHPNGKLLFRLDGRLMTEWTDLKTRVLEEQLPNILAKLELVAQQETQYMEQARLWHINWEKKRKLQAELECRRRKELDGFKDLLKKAERWKKAQTIRAYLAAIPNPEPDWLSWAIHKLDWYDPLINAEDEWLAEINKDEL